MDLFVRRGDGDSRRIVAGRVTKEVAFEPVVESLNDEIGNNYEVKYPNSLLSLPMIGSQARSTKGKIRPR
jgi:hypothetical protein